MSTSAPSTATVLEFRCLFTHDLRRKQKRWQDGRLKYHSFNARVMVYDERGNSVGDTHWHGDYEFGEGEEVQLERGGVIVQVEELLERRETDLSELVDKRVQEKQQRQIQQLARSVAPSAVLPRSLPRAPAIALARVQPRHRPLHNVIGTPTGHHGKALVPKESPFEQRQQAGESPDDRAAKRRTYDDPPPSKSGYAAALFGQSLTLSATPSISVPAIRRPRPEPSSDPTEEADTPGIREHPKPARRQQPQSPRRLAQPGYAQSLFGQNLTLSHTPVSSVPSKPQPRDESASSPMIDEDKEDSQETPRLPLRDQLTKSRLNESGGKPRSPLLGNQSNMDNGMAKGSFEHEVSGSHASVSRHPQAEKTGQIFPTDIDIIEIDDPDPVASSPARQPRPEKGTPAALRKLEVRVDRSNAISEQKSAGNESSSRPRKKQSLQNQRNSESKKGKGHEKAKEAEPAVAQATVRNLSSEQVASAAQAKAARVPDVTTKRDVPVTELRIKSSKKRGLLMISDAPKAKKTRRQAATNPARSFEKRSSHYSKDVDDDDPFRSPSPQSASKERSDRAVGNSAKPHNTLSRHTPKDGEHDDTDLTYPALNSDEEWDNEDVMGELGDTSVQRTISTELGEDDDPFRSQPPELLQQPESATRDRRIEQAGIPVQDTSNPDFSTRTDVRKEATDADQSAKHSSTPPRAGYDPYRIPSSPRPSNPASPSSAATKRREGDVDGGILRPGDKNKKLSKAKQQRHSRRKVISDEGDEGDTEPLNLLPKKASTGSGDEKDVASGLDGAVSKKLQKSRKVTSKKAIAQDVVVIGSGDEEPDRAAGKVRGQDKERSIESDEDEQPTKRRRSARRRRSRSTAYEEPSHVSSEQGDSEEEEAPRKRPKTKTSKASEDRPRLEKIKKNVKSRELIGFNLAALNAPLGFRGIGMPFSILSSPVNESIQRRVSNNAAAGESFSPVAVGFSGRQMLPPSPNCPAAPPEANFMEAQENPASVLNNEGRDLTTPANRGDQESHRNTNNGWHLGGRDRESPSHAAQEGPGNTISTEDRDSGRPAYPVANPETFPQAENKQIGEALSSKGNGTSRQQPAAIGPRLGARTRQTAAPMPRNNANGSPAAPNFPSLNWSVQGSSALRRQSSTGLKNVMTEDATPEVAIKTTTNAQPSSVPAPAPATKPATPTSRSLQETSHSTAQQSSKASQTIGDKTEALVEQLAPAKRILVDLNVIPAARPLLDASIGQLEIGIREQPSETEPLSAQRSSTKDMSNVSEGNQTIPTGASGALPPSKEPTPALTRQSSIGSGRDSLSVEAAVEEPDSVLAPALPVQQPRGIGLRRQVSAPRRINNIAAKLAPQAEATESSAETQARPAPNARIVNPASRGRKAALASHAAGQAPQRVLPPSQPALLLPISTADLAMTPIEQPAKEPERPKKVMRFPGFQSARSDGPWSREAFDLLESGRPE